MGITKSETCGHDLLPVSRIPEGNGVDYPEVSHLYVELGPRRGGVRSPMAVLGGMKSRKEATEIVGDTPMAET